MIAPCNKFLFRQVPIKPLQPKKISISSRPDEISVVEENSNFSHESSAFLPSMCGFKLAFSKIASLLKHINELRVLLSDNPLDILSINETRLDNSVGDDEVYIPGYDIIGHNCEHNSRFGGGVCIYVQPNANFSLRPDQVRYILKMYALRFVNLDLNPFLLLPGIGLLIHRLRYFLILNPLGSPDIKIVLLTNIFYIYNLHQLINSPTCITNASSTLIDVILQIVFIILFPLVSPM